MWYGVPSYALSIWQAGATTSAAKVKALSSEELSELLQDNYSDSSVDMGRGVMR